MSQFLFKKKGADSGENQSFSERRAFMRTAGLASASGLVLLSGCQQYVDELLDGDSEEAVNKIIKLGGGDIGVLNYAYALEQLEAAFYTMVVKSPSFGSLFDEYEQDFLTDIMYHEVVHREFFKAALGKNAIPELMFNFKSVNFNDRLSIFSTASTFEDLGVAAYNGAGKLIENPVYLALAGKIVSVEARHASLLREAVDYTKYNPYPTAFAGDDIIDMNGLDVALSPAQVLPKIAPYLAYQLDGTSLM